jgi:hypothetical protein
MSSGSADYIGSVGLHGDAAAHCNGLVPSRRATRSPLERQRPSLRRNAVRPYQVNANAFVFGEGRGPLPYALELARIRADALRNRHRDILAYGGVAPCRHLKRLRSQLPSVPPGWRRHPWSAAVDSVSTGICRDTPSTSSHCGARVRAAARMALNTRTVDTGPIPRNTDLELRDQRAGQSEWDRNCRTVIVTRLGSGNWTECVVSLVGVPRDNGPGTKYYQAKASARLNGLPRPAPGERPNTGIKSAGSAHPYPAQRAASQKRGFARSSATYGARHIHVPGCVCVRVEGYFHASGSAAEPMGS